jgi:hypothetical protein
MFDMAQEAVVLINPQTKQFVECNLIAHEHLGYTREEFMQLPLAAIEPTEASIDLNEKGNAIASRSVLLATQHRGKDNKTHEVKIKAKAIIFNKTPMVLTTWKYQ